LEHSEKFFDTFDLTSSANAKASPRPQSRAAAQGHNHDFLHWMIGRRANLLASAVRRCDPTSYCRMIPRSACCAGRLSTAAMPTRWANSQEPPRQRGTRVFGGRRTRMEWSCGVGWGRCRWV